MSRPQLLGLLLKVIGMSSMVNGLAGLPRAVSALESSDDEQELLVIVGGSVAMPLIMLASGGLLYLKTRWIVNLAYGSNEFAQAATPDQAEKEVLACLLKALGIWDIVAGIAGLPLSLAQIYQLRALSNFGAAYMAITIVAGCFLVFATDWFVNLAYPRVALGGDDEFPEVPPG